MDLKKQALRQKQHHEQSHSGNLQIQLCSTMNLSLRSLMINRDPGFRVYFHEVMNK
jgi:hypothetical protein